MNRVISDVNGGIPFRWDDLRFESAAVREAFKGLLSAYGIAPNDSFIISGIQITGQNYTAGYVCLSGEIYAVDAATAPTPGVGQINYWDIDISYDPNGNKQMRSGGAIQSYQIRKAKVVAGVAPVSYLPFDAGRMVAGENWRIVGTGSAPPFSSGMSSELLNHLRVKKDSFGNIHVVGAFRWTLQPGTYNTVFGLPNTYNNNGANQYRYITCTMMDVTTKKPVGFAQMNVSQNGSGVSFFMVTQYDPGFPFVNPVTDYVIDVPYTIIEA